MEGQSSFFQGARNPRVGDYTQFNQAGSVTNTYNVMSRRRKKQSIVPIKHSSKEIDPDNIIYRKHISSEDLVMHIEQGPLTNTEDCSCPRLRKIKVRKEIHTAEIVQYSGRVFTVYMFEPENREEKEALKTVWKRVYEVSSQRSLFFPQRFGIGRSKVPTLIVHDELVNADDFQREYWGNPITYNYLWYIHNTSFDAVRDNSNLAEMSIPISGAWLDWTVNLRTGSWHYDLPSIAVRGLVDEDTSHNPIVYPLTPLPPQTCLELDSQQILSLFEKHLGGFVHSLALWGEIRHFDKLTDFTPHGLLTFGALVDRTAGIVAHFPSTPTPEWDCLPFDSDVDARYSDLVPLRVDLSFTNPTGPSGANFHFRLRLPSQHRHQLRAAYLAQSLVFYYDNLVFIDEVCFSLIGTFHHNPSTQSPPAYLFVPPIQVEILHGLPCIKYPLPHSLFYWSLDRKGTARIDEADWEKYGIPELKVETWIGSTWNWWDYRAVEECFRAKGYPLDGWQYARECGYPELIEGDPHDDRLVEWEQRDSETESSWETKNDYFSDSDASSFRIRDTSSPEVDNLCVRFASLSLG